MLFRSVPDMSVLRVGVLILLFFFFLSPLENHSPRHPDHSTLIFSRSPHNILPINNSMLSSPEVSQAQHCAYDRPPGRPSSISRHPSVPPLRTVSAPTWPECPPWFWTSGSNLPTSNPQTFSNPFRMRSYKQTPCFARFWPKLSVSNSFRMRSYKNASP